MRRLAAKAIASVPGLRGLRARSRLRLAVLAISAAVLALGAVAIVASRDGATPERLASAAAEPGGETVIAKYAEAKTNTASLFSEPTPVNRLLSMALAPVPTIAPQPEEEPNLAGLSEIPKELIWNRPPEEEEEKKGQRSSFAAFSKARENLPWDAVEPVPFSPLAGVAEPAKTTNAPSASGVVTTEPVAVAGREVANWLKAKVTEIKGADRSRPLYHFELWLEPPAAVKGRLVGVSYAFSTPAIRPQQQASSDRGTGFRISAGGLACADEIVLTLRFDDGRVETVSVDGCKLLS